VGTLVHSLLLLVVLINYFMAFISTTLKHVNTPDNRPWHFSFISFSSFIPKTS